MGKIFELFNAFLAFLIRVIRKVKSYSNKTQSVSKKKIMDTALFKERLYEIKEILDKFNIEFWLDYGTLLGAYRDKRPLQWDLCDIDLGVKLSDVGLWKDELNKAFIDKGWERKAYFNVEKEYKFQRMFIKEGSHLDIWVHHKKDDFYFNAWYLGHGEYVFRLVPEKYYDTLQKIEFCGMQFNMPNEMENYLCLTYGIDWKTPIGTESFKKNIFFYKEIMFRRLTDWLEGRYDEERYLKESPWKAQPGIGPVDEFEDIAS